MQLRHGPLLAAASRSAATRSLLITSRTCAGPRASRDGIIRGSPAARRDAATKLFSPPLISLLRLRGSCVALAESGRPASEQKDAGVHVNPLRPRGPCRDCDLQQLRRGNGCSAARSAVVPGPWQAPDPIKAPPVPISFHAPTDRRFLA